MGHSLGGVTTMSLFPYLSQSHPTAIILVDPPLQQRAEKIAVKDAIFSASCIDIKGAGAYLAENTLWTGEDAIYRELGTRLADPEAVHGIYGRNQPWNFLHCFEKTSSKWKVTVLIADPAINQTCFADDLQPFPHVRLVHVPDAGHWIQYEFPGVVVEEALKTVAELKFECSETIVDRTRFRAYLAYELSYSLSKLLALHSPTPMSNSLPSSPSNAQQPTIQEGETPEQPKALPWYHPARWSDSRPTCNAL
ncbi:hypothetical protein J3R82DRAFT_4430 [Butyriboletus roseoflavus]|nr:hypothetical protein J3R82DRAFT_4430 [Butyriboletus roseoflavus]